MSSILIVGAGPSALSCAVALRCHGPADGLMVLDPSGEWLAAWHERFRRQDIAHLRSPAVHHPHPDPFALLAAGGTEGLVASGGTKLPTTRRFARFIGQLVDETALTSAVRPVAATELRLDGAGRAVVRDSGGAHHRPDRVVLATNVRRPAVPVGLSSVVDDPRVRLPDQVDVARTPVGGHVLVVGGGLSAGHQALGAARRGAAVTLLARRRLTVRRFDVHPSWLGPKKRRPFEEEADPSRRRGAIDRARGGGSIPHHIRRELGRCVDAGQLELRERVELTAVEEGADRRLRVTLSDGATLTVDEVWLATGGRVEVRDDPLCRHLVSARPTPIVGGLPELAPDLSWPGTNVHLTGFASALRLGPTAGNLVGHRRAALRIAAAVRGGDPDRADRIATGAGACPSAGPGGQPPPPSSRSTTSGA
jgi:cation diffusion facilitator CzcD-associated flavoprotein CzcO